ncbi:hypothetical protein B1J92_C00253g [Nakaseomyces glabratus]|nr:hypothetical protein B1J91_C00253g [Nakaseomyces glabratus]OXB50144.1 hypothetical protein B1J92_C00253g [Nakaseomyces glabratus]
MKICPIFTYIFWFTLWHTVAGTLYTDKEIVYDGSTTGTENPVFTDTTVLTLVNSKITIKNYAKVTLPAGFFLQNGSTLTILPLSGIDRPFSLDVNGDAKFTTASKFVFDGSKLSYSSSVQALNLFHFSFDLGAGGFILLQDDSFSVMLPTYGSYTLGSKRPSIKIGSTITDTLKYSPIVIYGTFTIDQTDRTHLYQVDFGPNKPVVAPGNAPALTVINTKIYGIACLYANIFQNSIGGSLSTSGLHAYVPQNAFTLNLLYQPTFANPNEEPYDILFTADQTALITIKNMIQYPSDIYQLQGPFPAIRVLSNGAGVLSSSFSDPNQLLNLAIGSANVRFRLPKPERKFDLLAIGSNRDLSPNYAIPSYSNVLTIALIGDLVIRPPFTTTHTDPKTTEILLISDYSSSDAANHQWVIGHSTITLYNQPQGDTKIIDLGNGVTEYQVLSYEPSQIQNPANPLKPYATVTRTVLYSPPPVITVSIDQDHEHIEEVVSYFITTDSNSKIITDSKVISITTKYDPAPDPETKIIDLGNEITEYLVISYWTTINDQGKIFTTSKVQTYSPPPVTITATTAADYVETDWISFFITTNDKGEIITDSTLFNATRDYNLPEAPHTSFGPAPPAETKTVDLGNEVTEYLVISYWTTTNEFGGLITTSSTRTYSPPPVTITATTAADYVETDWISFFITTNDKGEIITDSTLFNATRDYNLPEAPHTSFGPAPPAETKTVDLGNEVTEYLVISYWTTTNEFGGLITTSSTRTYSPPPVTITATTAADYVETDWISFFITTNDKGEIITDSTLFNATRDYNLPEAPHTSFGPAPPAETKTVDLGNEVTEYLVISYWTTTNEFGGLITTSSTRTYSPPPVTITATTAADYVETDWISFFITTNDKGEIITDSTLFNATRDYNLPEAPHTSFGPAPPAETKTVDLGNEVTEYLVISYWTTTNEFGGLITTSSTRTYSPPPVTITATTAADYVETDWISFFITTNDKGEIITDSTLFNATRDYNLPEAPHTSFGPAPPAETKTVDLGNEVTEYLVISYWTTTNEFGGLITTSSTRTYSPPPVTITATTAADYVETDWISFFITTNDKGEIITDSTLFNATRDYNLPEAPHTSFGPAPPAETKTVDLGNEVTEYLVISYWTTTNEFGGLITTSSTRTYSPPPVTITATTAADYVETDWISFFITTNDKGEIITDSTLFNATRDYNLPEAPHTSFGPAPPAETKTVDLGNEVTEYLVISYWTTTNEFGGLITTSSTRTYSPPPVTITATTAADYVETDWISFFITTNDKGEIITDSTLFNATRDYNLPEAPHTSFGPAPPAETKTVDLGNEVTEYLVISYWTTTNEFGGLITTSSTRTYSPPPVTITATTAADYVETDWISFFITTNDKGEIITDSTLFNATRDYNLPEAPHTSFGPAPPAETKTVDLGNEVTEYLVISYWTTTNEFGGLITTSSTRTYSPPPVTITATTAADYVETDWISFFITTNDKGEIITDSTLFNATRDYNLPEAPHTSFGPAPPAETKTVDLGNEVTEYLVISYWTTTNEFGGLITTSSTRTYSPPPVTITATTAADYVETDWISFFITTNDKGEIITDSTLFNATRDYNLPEAPHTSFGPAPPAETKTVDLGNEVTEYLVISYWTTTNEFGGLITTSSTRTYSPPPVTITATTAADYVETDWISFFITTNDKGEIITDSTLFNATRDYNLPEAPHTSFGPAPPAETKTVDLGNEVTEYLVISYWTTTNEFGGLITTSSTRTYSPPPVTITATTAADYVETDWISFFITTNDKGEIITDSTLFNATREYIDAEELYISSSSPSSSLSSSLSTSLLLSSSDINYLPSDTYVSTSSISSNISNSVDLSLSISSTSSNFSSDKSTMPSSSALGSDFIPSSSIIESVSMIRSSTVVSDIVTGLGSPTYSLAHSPSSDMSSINSYDSSKLIPEGGFSGSTVHHSSVYSTSKSNVNVTVSESSIIGMGTYDPHSTSTEQQDINEVITSSSLQSTYTGSSLSSKITSSDYLINSQPDTNASHILSHYFATSEDGVVVTSVATMSTVSHSHFPAFNEADNSGSSRGNTVVTASNSVINNSETNNTEQSTNIENNNSLTTSNNNQSEIYGTATTLTNSIKHTNDALHENSAISVQTSTSTLPNVSSKSILPTSSIQRTSQRVSEGTFSIDTLYEASGSHHKKSTTLLESMMLIFIIFFI